MKLSLFDSALSPQSPGAVGTRRVQVPGGRVALAARSGYGTAPIAMTVPPIRVRALNDRPLRPERDVVLYWMTSFRRAQSNFALDRALEHVRALKKPLVVLEALRVGYPFANDRLHTFLLQGIAENARRFAKSAGTHFPYVEERAGDGSGLLEAHGYARPTADAVALPVTVARDDRPDGDGRHVLPRCARSSSSAR